MWTKRASAETQDETTPEYTVVMSGNSFWVVLAIMISLDLLIVAAIVNGLKQDAVVQVEASASSSSASSASSYQYSSLPPPTPLRKVSL